MLGSGGITHAQIPHHVGQVTAAVIDANTRCNVASFEQAKILLSFTIIASVGNAETKCLPDAAVIAKTILSPRSHLESSVESVVRS